MRHVVGQLDYDTQVVIEAKRRKEALQFIEQWKDGATRRQWLGGTVSLSTNVLEANRRVTSRTNVFSKRRR